MLPLLGNAESVPYAPPYRTAAPVAYVASSQAPEHHNLLISALYISVCIYLSVFLLFKKKRGGGKSVQKPRAQLRWAGLLRPPMTSPVL